MVLRSAPGVGLTSTRPSCHYLRERLRRRGHHEYETRTRPRPRNGTPIQNGPNRKPGRSLMTRRQARAPWLLAR